MHNVFFVDDNNPTGLAISSHGWKQWTIFLYFFLTEIIIVDILQDVKASNNCNLSLQAPFIAWSCHKDAGDDVSPNSFGSRFILQTLVLWSSLKNLIVLTLTTFWTSFFRLLLYPFPGGEILGAWFASVPCQKAIVIIPILNFTNGWRFDSAPWSARSFDFRGSVISLAFFMVLGRVLYEKVRGLLWMDWSHMWATLCPPVVCWNTGIMGVSDVNLISCFAVIISYCPQICEKQAQLAIHAGYIYAAECTCPTDCILNIERTSCPGVQSSVSALQLIDLSSLWVLDSISYFTPEFGRSRSAKFLDVSSARPKAI